MEEKKKDTQSSEFEKGSYAEKLYLADFLREDALRSAIKTLGLASGSRGLDAGCGIGRHTLLLARAVGPGGHVTGLDLSSEFLAHAKKNAERSGMAKQVSFQQGNVNNLTFDNNTFDWVWSADCAGYPVASDPSALVKELARIVKPGGTIAILGWTSQKVLPGYPQLEARLDEAFTKIATYFQDMKKETHFLRALGWLRSAGLKDCRARTFTGEVYAPMSENVRRAMASLFDMLWSEAESQMTKQDWAEYQRLCLLESPECILNLPDYYAFFTYSLFYGKV